MRRWRKKLGLDEEEYSEVRGDYDEAFTLALHKDVRRGIVAERVRPDGRQLTEIRPLSSEVGFFAARSRFQLVYAWRDSGNEYCDFGAA